MTDLPKFGPGKPQEFNGMEVSYGVAAILNSIADLAYSQKKNYWTLYLVNVETLIRDRKNNEQDVSVLTYEHKDFYILHYSLYFTLFLILKARPAFFPETIGDGHLQITVTVRIFEYSRT